MVDGYEFTKAETPRSSASAALPPPSPRPVPLTKLFRFADRTDKLLMALGVVAAMATGCSQPLLIIFFSDAVSVLSPGADPTTYRSNVNAVVLKFVYVGVGVLVSGFVQVACWSITASRQAKRLRHAYASAILRQDIGWFDVNEPLQLASRIADTTLLVQNGMGRKVGDAINYATMGLSSMVLGFVYGWELSLVLFACIPFIVLSTYLMTKALTAAVQGGIDAYAEAGAVAEEALGNIKTVHMLNAFDTIAAKYSKALEKTQAIGVRRGLAVGLGMGSMFLCNIGSYGVGMYYGTVKIVHDRDAGCEGHGCYTGGHVLTVFFCVVLGAIALGQAAPAVQAITAGRAAASDIYALLARLSPIDATASTEGVKLGPVAGAITLENVTFAYPSRPNAVVCNGYSLHIPAGQKIAFVGPSGSGKSTIVSLLERFYDPLSGRVLLDGHDLRALHVAELRRHIGLVGQEPCLFADSIAANIRRGKPGATDAEVVAAAKQANAYDFVMAFPEGFETQVGDRGAQLSGGQKQRIAIARAILKDPAVLILDEATSALDTESEHVVQASLDRLVASGHRTTIIIAHRLSTIRNADRIVVLDRGNVVEDGTHDQLLALDGGHYKSLVAAQMLGGEGAMDDTDLATATTPVATTRRPKTMDDTSVDATSSEAQTDAPGAPASLWRLWALGRPDFVHFVCGSLGAIVHGAVYPVWGLLFTHVVVLFFRTDLDGDELRHRAMLWGIGFACLGVTMGLAILLQQHQFAVACERLTTRVRSQLFAAMLRQDLGWFDDHSTGALTTQLATDASTVKSLTTETLNAVLVNLASLVLAFAVAFAHSWQMTLVLCVIMPPLGFASYMEMQTASNTDKDVNDGDVRAGALLAEAISAIRTVASFGLESATADAYLMYLEASRATDIRVGLKSSVAYGISQGVPLLGQGFAFWCGGWLITRGDVTFQDEMTVMFAILFATNSIGMAMQGLGDIGKAKTAVHRVFALLDREPTIDAMATDGVDLAHVDGAIELRHVAFRYPSRPDTTIYSDYSLVIPAGQTLALVGTSGSGKSTAIGLIERFYDPVAGAVTIDGHDLRTVNVQSLRRHISLVSQEPVLFGGSIADNIAMGKPGATLDEVTAAATMANAHSFITQFPDGYATQVGDRGAQLSGGQKQRIAIARAIIGDPAILLLDEATSALDNESERVVQASLDALLQQKRRTTVVVAHRLSTIRNADLIAVVHDGGVSELGTHDQLMAIDGGIYRSLVARQLQA
ncbi:ATP-binding Cassette (ABC) Superfamily [Achlya hypogyna]|uniref:ATP-binding Cassette (ABC) Superfamily n=1 Tax=Achlya hypogyna TaxID=1202772 RepID=A0A1V9Y9A5_ACHHY|nr:ATP-binding Cassette (ABC) Superfamily [Achlya hypogyna]